MSTPTTPPPPPPDGQDGQDGDDDRPTLGELLRRADDLAAEVREHAKLLGRKAT
ncbi:hypothetical protein RKE29_06945 [Streptomyces sp. B1866]|uniref:hypothetical protein n=1 Tax=Streptomyces sp. B1866 TaxID=3075431 RepID=UPI00288DD08E|nr:hypothetical protein [Streptomyces sp. B1866]MDT3396378.1 hypothetical protein [Streptomyces sp. B1866]